jgi:hypothetical protein
MNYADLEPILSVIGKRLKGLSLKKMDDVDVNGILETCRNIQLMYFTKDCGKAMRQDMRGKAKGGLVRLKHFEVDDMRVKLGSEDWLGYDE